MDNNKHKFSNFLIEYNLKDEKFKKAVELTLIESYEKFFNFFDQQIDNVLTVKIFSTRESYKEWTGYGDKYQDWMVGKCIPKENVIAVIIPQEANRSKEDMLMVVKHEMFHYFLEKTFGEIKNIVLDEGIACYLASQMPNFTIDIKKAFPIKNLSGENFVDLWGYTLAPVYVKYIIDKFGLKKLKEIICLEDFYLYLPKGIEKQAIKKHNKFIGQ